MLHVVEEVNRSLSVGHVEMLRGLSGFTFDALSSPPSSSLPCSQLLSMVNLSISECDTLSGVIYTVIWSAP